MLWAVDSACFKTARSSKDKFIITWHLCFGQVLLPPNAWQQSYYPKQQQQQQQQQQARVSAASISEGLLAESGFDNVHSFVAFLESHDSETTLCKMQDGAFADMKRGLANELRSCRAFPLCMDEKDIFLVVVVKVITEEWDIITRLLSYRGLTGFTAPEILGSLQQMLTERLRCDPGRPNLPAVC